MRVTQNMMNSSMVRNMNNSMGSMSKTFEQLATGKKISRPSDDPVVAARGMYYRTTLTENQQYTRNAGTAKNWMDSYDTTMDEVGKVYHRIRELVVSSGDGAYGEKDRETIAAEIKELKKHLGSLANQTVNGKYIFAGDDTSNPPLSTDPDGKEKFKVNTGTVEVEMGTGVQVQINIDGQKIFNHPSTTDNIFTQLDQIIAKLEIGESAADSLDKMDEQVENLLVQRAGLGAKSNRLDMMMNRLESEEVSIYTMLSENEDVNQAEAITQLKMQEAVHRMALGAGARIIQPSLLDFLR